MMTRIRQLLQRDEGLGLILVIGMSAFIAGLAATAGVIAANGLRQSSQRVMFEQSLASAEAGVDYALSNLQRAFDEYNADFPIPSPPSTANPTPACNASVVALPASFASQDAEETWARNQLNTLRTQHPECVQKTPSGEVLVLKPGISVSAGAAARYGRVYAQGWSPSRSATKNVSRMVKAEYIFTPYRPQHAILTGSDLKLQSTSTNVTTVPDSDPKLASVHTNGSLTVIGQPVVSGEVSVSGTYTGSSTNFASNPGGNPIVRPKASIPKVDAEAFYYKAPSIDANAINSWYDLCEDGKVRSYNLGGGPCGGTVLAELGENAASFRGWTYTRKDSVNPQIRMWTATRDTLSGTYFVNKADVNNGPGNGSIPNITVIASAENQDSCTTKRFGNIIWDHFDTVAPAFRNLFFMADSDLQATSNFFSGTASAGNTVSGMYVAGDQTQVWTSSSGLVGSVLAADQCSAAQVLDPYDLVLGNEVQGQIVQFDPNSDSPFTSIITTTLWLEY